eukprot:m51a1_g5121 5'-nucleotidase, putative (553) ;mRNA; f:376755-378939
MVRSPVGFPVWAPLLPLLLLLAACCPAGRAEIRSFTLVHINDFHGWLQPEGALGGGARVAALAAALRARSPGSSLLLDAGDVTLGAPPISQLVNGSSAVDLFNLLGVNVSVFGNHEFDRGQESLAARVRQARFPWLGANIVRDGAEPWAHPAWARPYATFRLATANVTVGVIGVTTEETPAITMRGLVSGLTFVDPVEAIVHYYDIVREQSDIVVVLAHIGMQDVAGDGATFLGLRTVARRVAARGKYVPLFVGGHDHVLVCPPIRQSGSALVEAQAHGHYVGSVDVVLDTANGTVLSVGAAARVVDNATAEDPEAAALVARWAASIEPLVRVVVGTTTVPLVRSDKSDGTMGNLVCDSMLWYARRMEERGATQICFMNAGGIRTDLGLGGKPSRDITWGDTYSVLPFDNTLVVMNLTGFDVLVVLERGAKLTKGLVATAGLTYKWWNTAASYGVTDVMVGGRPLDYRASYRVVTNNFLAQAGDSWAEFEHGVDVSYSPKTDSEVLDEYIATGLHGRITARSIAMGRATRSAGLRVAPLLAAALALVRLACW